jgi:hypothetical protein
LKIDLQRASKTIKLASIPKSFVIRFQRDPTVVDTVRKSTVLDA